ncbi:MULTISPECIES: UDP-glucuronic acid decarboxylase family protein [unclassified Kitasatospora]|uniref:UDP-glucuronic acid decarboxylase family protein n=1 Tax=unclassified Kitasatospora TaxID=2633591 RepID=UPI001F466E22|nr:MULTISPECIES: UDP-glucuronic acid decarboxylase family protein [unclassified Kitasatospora]
MVAGTIAAFEHRRVLVTGAAGFIGSHLVEHLLDLGAEVVGVDNLATGRIENLEQVLRSDHFTFEQRDITAPLKISGLLDFVFHLASPASPFDYARLPLETLKVGAIGTLHTLDIAQAKQARLLLASTSEIYGDPLVHPQDEQYWGNVNPVGPRSVYDEAKRYAEALVTCFRTTGRADTVIVRIFNTYGPRMRHDDGRAVPAFFQQALAGEPLTVAGDGLQTRSLCYVDDTVQGLLAAAASDCPGPVNIGNPREISVLQLAEEIRLLADSTSPITFVPLPADDPRRRCPDITLARTELGWEPRTDLADGLRRTLAWVRGASYPTANLPAVTIRSIRA